MSAPIETKIAAGDLDGKIYDFALAGDVLPMHRHNRSTTHVTIVAGGSFICCGPLIGEQVVTPGAFLDFDDDVEHEFRALENNSRLVNITKYRA